MKEREATEKVFHVNRERRKAARLAKEATKKKDRGLRAAVLLIEWPIYSPAGSLHQLRAAKLAIVTEP
jgi:hypothetical protein